VYIGNRYGKSVEGIFQITTTEETKYPDSWRAQQILATIAALDYVGRWIDTTRGQKIYTAGHATEMPEPLSHARSEVVAQISDVNQENDSLWRYVRAIVKDAKHFGISLGESFTGGALTSLLHSLPHTSRYIDSSIVWYDKSFKHAFGVRDDLLGAEQIASLATARDCAAKLLKNAHHQGGNTQTAIATTGRACRLGGLPDDLYVAVSSKAGDSVSQMAAKMLVTSTQDIPLSPFAYDRNELSRQLGVSMSVLLLGGALAQHYPKYRPTLIPNLKKFGNFIGTFGELKLEVSN
jgi:nicotinamide mononucleotide (NMN) deamidase PncC